MNLSRDRKSLDETFWGYTGTIFGCTSMITATPDQNALKYNYSMIKVNQKYSGKIGILQTNVTYN
jgi:hypothetical protein